MPLLLVPILDTLRACTIQILILFGSEKIVFYSALFCLFTKLISEKPAFDTLHLQKAVPFYPF